FGSPAYLAKHGRPRRPDQLTQHHCILRASGDHDAEKWLFRIAGRNKTIRVQGRLHTDSTAAVHTAVVRGLGIGRAPLWQIRSLVDAGAVEVILEDFETSKIPVHVVWSPTKMQLARNRLFTDFLAERLKGARL